MDFKQLQNQKFKKAFAVDKPLINVEARTVEFPFSSEVPVQREMGMEILDHSPESVDLDRLRNAAPLLWNHDTNNQIGVVESVELKLIERRLWCVVRFSKNKEADEVFQDVIDGIKRNVSFGYCIGDNIAWDDAQETTYRVKQWFIYEISIVSVPADYSVGIGRALEVKSNETNEIKDNDEAVVADTEKPVIEVKELQAVDEIKNTKIEVIKMDEFESRKAEEKEILAVGKAENMMAKAYQAIGEGKSYKEFVADVSKELADRTKSATFKMDAKDVEKYDAKRAFKSLLNGEKQSYEHDVSQQYAKDMSLKAPRGLYIPHNQPVFTREFTALNGGAGVIGENLMGSSYIDLLRNKMVTGSIGVRTMGGLSSSVAIPKATGTSTVYFIDDNGDIDAGSNPTIGQVTLSPKNMGAYIDIGRNLALQASVDVMALGWNDLLTNMALASDKQILNGTGANGQAKGIYKQAGVGTVVVADGKPDRADILAFIAELGAANANRDNAYFVFNSVMSSHLRGTAEASGFPKWLLSDESKVEGFKTAETNQLADNELILGDFSQALLGLFGGLDLYEDRSTGSKSGMVRIVALQSFDVAVRNAGSFCTMVASGASSSSSN